jgi:GMP synthase PP-ATPase subunit
MRQPTLHPPRLPTTRILGDVNIERRTLLSLIDVVVGYVSARHRHTLRGWSLEAALVEQRPGFRGGETVALRAAPNPGYLFADLPPVPFGVLREIASRLTYSLDGIANVVPDVTSSAPDVEGFNSVVEPEQWLGGAQTA